MCLNTGHTEERDSPDTWFVNKIAMDTYTDSKPEMPKEGHKDNEAQRTASHWKLYSEVFFFSELSSNVHILRRIKWALERLLGWASVSLQELVSELTGMALLPSLKASLNVTAGMFVVLPTACSKPSPQSVLHHSLYNEWTALPEVQGRNQTPLPFPPSKTN